MSYSIVVVTWECADYLARLVDSMNAQLDGSQELVVVDNASTDDPGDAANAWRGRSELIRRSANDGFGTAANEGVRRATEDVVVLLNPDTLLVGGLEHLTEISAAERAIVGPRMLNRDGSVQPSASGPPVGVWPWINALLPAAALPAPLQARTEPWRLERRARVGWLTGACLAAPRDVLLELGPFDPSLHLLSEDLDLCLRATRQGVPVLFDPTVEPVVHFGDGSMRRRFDDAGASLAVANRRRVLAARFSERAAARSAAASQLNLLLRIAAKTLVRRPHARERLLLRAWRKALR